VKFSWPAKLSGSHSLYITEKIHWLFGDTDSVAAPVVGFENFE
jgi:hypothetical protein